MIHLCELQNLLHSASGCNLYQDTGWELWGLYGFLIDSEIQEFFSSKTTTKSMDG
jgi:hypothetical protein